MSFRPTTIVSKLPWALISALYKVLDSDDAAYQRVCGLLEESLRLRICSPFSSENTSRSERLLMELGNAEWTAQDLLELLDKCQLEVPQLYMRRKFRPVRIVEQTSELNVTLSGDKTVLKCKAFGFPYPRYQWLKNDRILIHGKESELEVDGINLASAGRYCCVVYNEVGSGEPWTAFYHRDNKQFSSEMISNEIVVDVIPQGPTCPCCALKVRSDNSVKLLDGSSTVPGSCCLCRENSEDEPTDLAGHQDIILPTCKATDKVALIICNSEYSSLPPLLTPVADAECLAAALLEEGFKTVTLADLNLQEMRGALKEYAQLLGAGVYAVFYFVGHGFEFRGQCYLLPVDAPCNQYQCGDCLCAEEVLSTMQETNPFLNVILLDMCRRCPPQNVEHFCEGLTNFRPKVNRNTVFGYATSFGEGAYEVRGEPNGIFMKYLQRYLHAKKPVIEILNLVLQDLESDRDAKMVQFPELKTNLSRPRGLCDQLDYHGFTTVFGIRTVRWQMLHEIPNPVKVQFTSFSVVATVWFDFCGHFTNIIYLYCSVAAVGQKTQHRDALESADIYCQSKFIATVNFPKHYDATHSVITTEEGTAVRILLKHLQRVEAPLCGTVELADASTQVTVASQTVELGDLLIFHLCEN